MCPVTIFHDIWAKIPTNGHNTDVQRLYKKVSISETQYRKLLYIAVGVYIAWIHIGP